MAGPAPGMAGADGIAGADGADGADGTAGVDGVVAAFRTAGGPEALVFAGVTCDFDLLLLAAALATETVMARTSSADRMTNSSLRMALPP